VNGRVSKLSHAFQELTGASDVKVSAISNIEGSYVLNSKYLNTWINKC
jgi:hypothetical protein